MLSGSTFLADILAFAGRERPKEFLKAGIAPVLPMELNVAARQPPCRLEQRHLLSRDESGVSRGQAVRLTQLLGGAQQRYRQCRIGEQQSPSCCRGKRHRDLEFGVIAPARIVPGFGPAVIEDILALTVALEIGGKRGSELSLGIFDHDRCCAPASARANAARILQRGQERMRQERIAARQRIPLPGLKLANRTGNPRDDTRLAHAIPAPSAIGASVKAAALSRCSAELTVQVSSGRPRRRWAAAKRLGKSRMS